MHIDLPFNISLPSIGTEDLLSWVKYDPNNPLLFSSMIFWGIFILFYALYIVTKDCRKFRTLYVILFSLFYYYKVSGFFVLLLMSSISFNFILSEIMDLSSRKWKRKALLNITVILNLAILGYFKYTRFFIENFNVAFDTSYLIPNIILPIGISFYTFQAISYSVDLYRKEMKPAKNILDFAFYLSFFPQLVSGPIVRAKTFLPQMKNKLSLSSADGGIALFMIMMGLIKKTIISDYISINFVSRIFDSPLSYTALENLIATYGYTIQIYCDFSGYSDIAIGLGLLMGFKLPKNFHTPYKSQSVTEFWKRWHISLSTWLRDYLYIPLGGNRKGKIRTYINLFLTMLIGGLWHGASWRFIIWGGLHGLILVIERFFKQTFRKPKNVITRIMFMILYIVITLMLFSTEGIKQTLDSFSVMHTFIIPDITYTTITIIKYIIIAFILGYIIYIVPRNRVVRFICIVVTFHFVSFCWIFFRADSFDIAWQLIGHIGDLSFTPDDWMTILIAYKYVFMVMLVGYILHFLPERFVSFVQKGFIWLPFPFKALILGMIFWLIYATASSDPQPFIYFKF